ncbi:RlmE family RNA methyltransferase [Viridibacterium curvum]|uniref:Ribosomal RNA large subunit methyltransferase E n=1 Tax=Viridibacterium curvum TaxID=1101404 RepID=A0ABP9QYD8_9RHOO
MKPSKTSKGWMKEHLNDPWVQKARAEGYRARAAYKLMEIDDKDHLLKPGMVVVDLGAAPGSWCQVAVKRIQPGGLLLALDILPMDPVPGVSFLQGDFREDTVLAEFERLLDGRTVDLVLSDMAPNISGVSVSDDGRMMHLAELALDFAANHLRPGGNMLIKLFQGAGFMDYRKAMQQMFGSVLSRKPEASRDRSAEVYLLGLKKSG